MIADTWAKLLVLKLCSNSLGDMTVKSFTCVTMFFVFFYKEVKLVGGGSVINGAYPVWFII